MMASSSVSAVSPLMRVRSGASASLLIRAGGLVAAFVLHMVLARVLDTEQYGIYSYVLTLMPLLAMIAKFGLAVSSARFIPEYVTRQQWDLLHGFLRWSGRSVMWLTVAVLVSSALLLVLLRTYLPVDILISCGWSLLILPVLVLVQVQQDLLRSLKWIAASQVCEQIALPALLLTYVAVVCLAGHQPQASSVLLWHLVALVTSIGALAWLLRAALKPYPRARPEIRSQVWRNVSLSLGASGVVGVFLARCDLLFIGGLLGSDQVALYAVPAKIASLLGLGLASVIAAVSPSLAEVHARGDRAELQRLVSTTGRWVAWGTLPLACGCLLMAPLVLGVFGPQYLASRTVLYILVVGQVANILTGVVEALLAMTDLQHEYLQVLAVVACGTAVAMPLAIHWGGIEGAAVISCCSMLIWKLWLARIAYVRLGIRILPCWRVAVDD